VCCGRGLRNDRCNCRQLMPRAFLSCTCSQGLYKQGHKGIMRQRLLLPWPSNSGTNCTHCVALLHGHHVRIWVRTYSSNTTMMHSHLSCPASTGRLSIAFFINGDTTAPPPVPPAGVSLNGYGYRVGWAFPTTSQGAFLMLTASPVALSDAVPTCP